MVAATMTADRSAKAVGMDEKDRPTARKASFAATIKAVFWSFFGVRKKSDYESDAANLNPVHVIIAGVIGAILFIVILMTIVRLVLAK